MAIFSWLRWNRRSERRSAVDEFREFAQDEAKHRANSDQVFDQELHQQAVERVLDKLRQLEARGQR